jgi:glycosyltransferase involved in cell wall biosynthesis
MIVLIPAYEPGLQLVDLILKIKEKCSFKIVIVDDGSGKKYKDIFKKAEQLGCTILTHENNKGKGCALKTGFSYIMENTEAEEVVTADCDGQHLPEDIMRIAEQVGRHREAIILGCRRFSGKVPLRSRFGNTTTRLIFSFITGITVYDTQTGLRGFSSEMLQWLCSIPGERFEYEMNMLLEAHEAGYQFYEVDIDTVYIKRNKSSHFHTIKDSARVYLPIIKFSAAGLIAGIVDFTLLVLIKFFTSNLFFAVIGARICSLIVNYTLTIISVFSRKNKSVVKTSISKFFTLASIVMFINYIIMYILNSLIGISLFFSKLITEAVLFFFSYWSQNKFIYGNRHTENIK